MKKYRLHVSLSNSVLQNDIIQGGYYATMAVLGLLPIGTAAVGLLEIPGDEIRETENFGNIMHLQ